jgi:RNA-directed DNA polymerase
MALKDSVVWNLAYAFLAGPWSVEGLVAQGARACGGRERWLRPLVRRLFGALGDAPAVLPGAQALASWIEHDAGFSRAWARHCRDGRFPFREVFRPAAVMAPASWQVHALPTPGALADWLSLTPRELDWFADCHGRLADVPPGPLHHYSYQWLAGRRGKFRLLEMPKQRLKALQRRLLHELLERIPLHEAAHGYRRGRSVATYVAPHAGQDLVLRFDLRDFFPSIRAARIHALFRTAGYPVAVARLLTGLCTGVVPADVLRAAPASGGPAAEARRRALYQEPHLPQGAPTSPALANLCAFRLDCRLAALARTVGASYTRYADDLAFSGCAELERAARRFQVQVCRLALEEGFEVQTRKTRFMRQGVRQQLAGVVLNAHPNVPRSDYDRLKAILHNCMRHGPEGQNRDGHDDFRAYLAGRIAYVAMLNPDRGRKLRTWFERIRWP